MSRYFSSPWRRPRATLLALLSAMVMMGGCANIGVEPWDRDLLARSEMQLVPDPLVTAFDEHVYFSKEASSGGQGFGGGGCGCN